MATFLQRLGIGIGGGAFATGAAKLADVFCEVANIDLDLNNRALLAAFLVTGAYTAYKADSVIDVAKEAKDSFKNKGGAPKP